MEILSSEIFIMILLIFPLYIFIAILSFYLISKLQRIEAHLLKNNNKVAELERSYGNLFEMYKSYFIPMFNQVRHINDLTQQLKNLDISMKKFSVKLLEVTYRLSKNYVLISHLGKQILTKEVLAIVENQLSDAIQVTNAQSIDSDPLNIDMPTIIKGTVGENVVEEFLKLHYPEAVVINQSLGNSVGDIVFIINGKTILIEVKNWRKNVDSENISNFHRYCKNAKYHAGMLINIDRGKITKNGVDLEGFKRKYSKFLVYVPALIYDFTRFKNHLDVLIDILN